jgi:hypothetical protein
VKRIDADRIDLTLGGHEWGFADREREAISRHWDELAGRMPDIWNGEVLMARDVVVQDGALKADLFCTDYASFIAWQHWGFPDREVFNCFGSAVIVARDGALIYGAMGGHTLNAGLCYPPGGSLDMGDVAGDGRVDVLGSIARELTEETGLVTGDAEVEAIYFVPDCERISIAQVLRFDAGAEQLAASCRAHIARQALSELADVVVLSSLADVDPDMPGYAQELARFVLAGR